MDRLLPRLSWAGAILGIVFFSVMAVSYSVLNQDEGWYLYAALLVSDGAVPYRDFCYTQTPLLPILYSLFTPLINSQGLLGGRLLTLAFGLGSTACSMLLVRELISRHDKTRANQAACLVLVLLGGCVFQLSFFSTVKTYSAASFFLMGGLLALARARRGGAVPWLIASALLFSCAAGVRLSAAMVLPVCCFYLLLRRTDYVQRAWLYFGMAGLIFSGLILLPFYLISPENFFFGILDYHQARDVGAVGSMLTLKAAFFLHQVRHYAVWLGLAAILLSVFGVPGLFSSKSDMDQGFLTGFIRFGWAVFMLTTVLHLTASFPYPEYQVMIMPIAAVLIAIQCVQWFPSKLVSPAIFCVMIFGLIYSSSSPLVQDWASRGMDRIWPVPRESNTIREVRQAAAVIREHAGQGELLLSQDLYLAVETGMRVPDGWEMGPFSYMPSFDTATAETLHVMNAERLSSVLTTADFKAAAVSGYSFAIACPQVQPVEETDRSRFLEMIQSRATLIEEFPMFGQNNAGLSIYAPLNSSETSVSNP
jgi:hypothetical protein